MHSPLLCRLDLIDRVGHVEPEQEDNTESEAEYKAAAAPIAEVLSHEPGEMQEAADKEQLPQIKNRTAEKASDKFKESRT